ncbi:MAG TPA: hypothetical protein VG899_09200 [Mycobacteriales bacterium]|nr:hypothetical protein [Mycobacteriales bacterium]
MTGGLSSAARLVAAAAVVVVGVGVAAARHGSSGPLPLTPSLAATRYAAIERVLTARGQAIVHHDRHAFLATVDPRNRVFRRSQARMFTDLARVPLRSWSYAMTARGRALPADAAAYDAPVWAPRVFTLGYRLADFDRRPTSLRQYPTFVDRHGRWYLASLSDYTADGLVSATDLWDYGPVAVVRRPDVLVLGPPSQRQTMRVVAGDVQLAIPQVSSVWGRGWSRRAVVLLPRTQREMALIDEDHEDLAGIAALTSAEVRTAAGHPSPVGDRITINPANWHQLSPLGQQVVLRHELTHVASEAATGTHTPTWLIEGLADYVGYRFADVPVTVAAAELQRVVRGGRLPGRLPPDRAFRGAAAQLAVSYEQAWFVCRTIAQRFGVAKLVAFYRAVGASMRPPGQAVRRAVVAVLHLRLASLVALWRAEMLAALR